MVVVKKKRNLTIYHEVSFFNSVSRPEIALHKISHLLNTKPISSFIPLFI